jgi:hypothetical protein
VRIALAAALGALALGLAGAASGATAPKETRYVDKPDGFSILLPPKWYAVPRSVKAVQQTIALAKKDKLNGLPTAYSFYLTAAGKAQLKAFSFQAFLNVYPSTDPLIPQVAVQISKPSSSPYKPSQLNAAALTFGEALSQNKGAKVTKPTTTKLPAGTAKVVIATTPVGSGLTEATTLYLLIHGGKLYVLKFDIDAASFSKSAASVFRSIAQNFAFV